MSESRPHLPTINMATTNHFQFPVTFLILLLLTRLTHSTPTNSIPHELLNGFSATPQQSPTTSFQPLLTDPTGNFTLGFLRQNQNHLTLAILHAPTSEPFWLANPTHLATWSKTTTLTFNRTLTLSDPTTNLLWSTNTTQINNNGNRLLLLNNSNLQIQLYNTSINIVLWQSFHFPSNTLVQGQNFTSHMSLVSLNGLYSLRLGNRFMGLYANHGIQLGQLYWKLTPLEAKAEIQEGKGPIYARVDSDGYLAMYQTRDDTPVDVQKFDSSSLLSSFVMVRLELAGNLKGYYWDGVKWVLNFRAVSDTCELPNPCGAYGLCTPGGSDCGCLDNRTRFGKPGGCGKGDGDLCGGSGEGYWVLRRVGVEPAHKELLGRETTSSLEECEGLCETNCSCWGALYNNVTEFCYIMDYPVQNVLGTGDEYKVGYFKVIKGGTGGGGNRIRAGVVVGGVLVGVVVVGLGIYVWVRCKRREQFIGLGKEENGALPGPYKNIGSRE